MVSVVVARCAAWLRRRRRLQRTVTCAGTHIPGAEPCLRQLAASAQLSRTRRRPCEILGCAVRHRGQACNDTQAAQCNVRGEAPCVPHNLVEELRRRSPKAGAVQDSQAISARLPFARKGLSKWARRCRRRWRIAWRRLSVLPELIADMKAAKAPRGVENIWFRWPAFFCAAGPRMWAPFWFPEMAPSTCAWCRRAPFLGPLLVPKSGFPTRAAAGGFPLSWAQSPDEDSVA